MIAKKTVSQVLLWFYKPEWDNKAYQMPNIEELLSVLDSARYFTTLGATSGYWSIPITDESKIKTSFSSGFGKFMFSRLPFGISNGQRRLKRLWTKCCKAWASLQLPMFPTSSYSLRIIYITISDMFNILSIAKKVKLLMSNCNFADKLLGAQN